MLTCSRHLRESASVQAWWRALRPPAKVMRRGFTLMAACARKRLQEWKVERGEGVLA